MALETSINKKLPKRIRNLVWDTYIGCEHGIGKCFCCGRNIDAKFFETGHIVSRKNGGSDEIDNLRPVCAECNRSIGVNNMLEFKNMYFNNNTKKEPVDLTDKYKKLIYKIASKTIYMDKQNSLKKRVMEAGLNVDAL